MPKVPYPYEVNGKLVTGNGSLIPICSLSNNSLLPSLTVVLKNRSNEIRIRREPPVLCRLQINWEILSYLSGFDKGSFKRLN